MIAAAPEGEEVAAWLICDHAFQRRYPFGMAKPFPVPVWPYLRSGYLKRGRTLAELAAQVRDRPGRPGARRWRRSTSTPGSARTPSSAAAPRAFNRGSGDPEHEPNPSLAPIEKAPFYAIKVLPGSFGTFAGLQDRPAVPGARRRRRTRSPACTPPAATRPT